MNRPVGYLLSFMALLAGLASANRSYASDGAAWRPQRIVSLNLCIDPIVLSLVSRERIAALSEVSADRHVSAIADRVGGLKLIRGAAEEVLALEPDLVLAGAYTTTATVDLLRRLGRKVVIIPLAQTFADVRAGIRAVAAAVGEYERGEDLVAAFDRSLPISTEPPTTRPSATVYHVNGLVSAGESLLDEALASAGFANGATHLDLRRGGRVDLESLLTHPPDLLALAQAPDAYRTVVAENVRHPALQALRLQRPSEILPMPLWICGTPEISIAVAKLAHARRLLASRAAVPGPAMPVTTVP